jgi:hypothetical protein
MPTFPALSKIVELPSVELLVQIGMKLVFPEPENVGELAAVADAAAVPDVDVIGELLSRLVPGVGARRNADGGSPPIVAASDARKA